MNHGRFIYLEKTVDAEDKPWVGIVLAGGNHNTK